MWAILALVLLADALDMIDSTVTNIAAPTIAAHLGGGGALIKWLGTSYMLALGVLLGRGLGDKYGQRRLFLLGCQALPSRPAPALFTIGIGMGCCYSTVFDVALGDIAPEEAGSASGSLSSVQQLAAGIGSAVVTTVFLRGIGNSPAHAMTLSLIVVAGLLALAAPLVTLMPAKAPPARPLTRVHSLHVWSGIYREPGHRAAGEHRRAVRAGAHVRAARGGARRSTRWPSGSGMRGPSCPRA